MALPTLSGLTKSIYGTNASDASNPNMSGVDNTMQVRSSKLLDIANKAVAERVRRGGGSIAIPTGYYDGLIYGSRVQDIRTVVEIKGPAATQAYNGAGNGTNSSNGLVVTGSTTVITGYDYYGQPVYGTQTTYGPVAQPEVITYPQAALPSGAPYFARSDQITAIGINALITEINNAGAVCLCNCNYCTCNCNYCTCNCNYSCTCNCNY